MKRSNFLKKLGSLGLFTLGASQVANAATLRETEQLRKELLAAWQRSEKMTLTNVEQMPPELFTFRYTEEAMTFSEQWRHCVVYTCGQLASRAGLKNPYQDVKLPVQMPKEDVIKELKNMYTFVRQSIQELSIEQLCTECNFAGDTIPVWRLFYAMENHIIHHRGQCIVYLRLNGVIPKGYYGW
ncbi:MAG: DinB family protein [Cyclobacteriaceae bacterium]